MKLYATCEQGLKKKDVWKALQYSLLSYSVKFEICNFKAILQLANKMIKKST